MKRSGSLPVSVLLLACAATGAGIEGGATTARLEVADLFSDHMVLQRDLRLPVWGWARPGTAVVVDIAGCQGTTTADEQGAWRVTLPPVNAGGPYVLTVRGGDPSETIVIADVLVGDVWVCGGQANMEWPLQKTSEADAEMAGADDTQLRHFAVQRVTATVPLDRLHGSWAVASPQTVGGWTAVGYFFGRELRRHTGVPVGLIHVSWGPTRVEAWTSEAKLNTFGDIELEIAFHRKLMARDGDTPYETRKAEWDLRLETFIRDAVDTTRLARWSSPDLDDRDWETLFVTEQWDFQGIPQALGEGWYRRAVEIPARWVDRDLLLGVGRVDEIDVAFFNGTEVGRTGSVVPYKARRFGAARTYRIPRTLVRPGKATLAVQVVNLCGRGGLWGYEEEFFLGPEDSPRDRLAVDGQWRFEFASRLPDKPLNPASPNTFASLFNGLVHPMIPFGIKGVVWYQGENNLHNPRVYRERFTGMIQDWRDRWGQGDFPFYWVQHASYELPSAQPRPSAWADLRQAQTESLALSNTAQALAIDLGDPDDPLNIEPGNKRDVGHRLALLARRNLYGETTLVAEGPILKDWRVEGADVLVEFDPRDGGALVVRDGGEIRGFLLAGTDRHWFRATAQLVSATTVRLHCEQVPEPVAVRFAYEDNPTLNLYNGAGLPARPFRTNDWKWPAQSKP